MADNKDGMRTYAVASRIIAERNEAISQAKFWRKIATVLAVAGFASNLSIFGNLSGWW